MGMALSVEHLSCGFRDLLVLRNINFHVDPGEILCMLGPNGVGKTTLIRTIVRFLPALSGTVRVGGVAAAQLSRNQFARRVGCVPQSAGDIFNFVVRDVVMLGRTQWLGIRGTPSRRDRDITDETLANSTSLISRTRTSPISTVDSSRWAS